MRLTLQIKLLPIKEQEKSLKETLVTFNSACDYVSNIAWTHKEYNQYRLHALCYSDTKTTFSLTAQAVIRCLANTINTYKTDKLIQHKFKPLGAMTYDCRILSYSTDKVSIWTINGRLKIPFVCHKPEWIQYTKGEADLVLRNGKYYLLQCVEIPEDDPINFEGYLGVDMGITNIATTSDNVNYSGKQCDTTRTKMTTIKRRLQSCGSKSAKRHLKRLSGRERRFKRNTNHTISKQIIQHAKGTNKAIAIENLKGFKVTVCRQQRERFGKWSFDELSQFIHYKAKLKGIPVVKVNPRNTSRKCSACGYIDKANRKSQSEFVCKHCNLSLNADFNAALNIAALGAVNHPIVVPQNGLLLELQAQML